MPNQTKNQNSNEPLPKIDLSELSYGDKLMLADMDEGFKGFHEWCEEQRRQGLLPTQKPQEEPMPPATECEPSCKQHVTP